MVSVLARDDLGKATATTPVNAHDFPSHWLSMILKTASAIVGRSLSGPTSTMVGFQGCSFRLVVPVAGQGVNWGSLHFQTDSESHPIVRQGPEPCLPSSPHPVGTPRARGRQPRWDGEMTALGLEGPVLIIAGKTVIGLLAQTWQRSLDEAGLKHAVHRFGGECSLAEIERVKAAARELRRGRSSAPEAARSSTRPARPPPIWVCPWSIAPRWPPATLLAAPFPSFTRKKGLPAIPLLPQEPGPGPGRYRGDRPAPPRLLVAGMGMLWPPGSRPRRASRGT